MIVTECNGGVTCLCPVIPGGHGECYGIWGWVILTVFIISSLTFCVWWIWSTFFRNSATVSASERLQRQKTFWVLTSCFLVVQILMALTMHQDDPVQLMAWLGLSVIVGIWFALWSLRRKRG